MKIVTLDGYAANPGDLSWAEIEKYGELVVYDRTEKGELDERIKDADIVLTNKTPLSRRAIFAAEKLKFISVLATGYNIVDIEAAKERGIAVSNVPAYSTNSVAQLAMAMVLETASLVGEHNKAVQAGAWARSKDFCFWNAPLTELCGKTIGIFGCGSIGRATAKIADAFGMKVLAYSRSAKPGAADGYINFVSKEELFASSNYISLHCPLNDESRYVVNSQSIAKMKDGAVVINTARGACVNSLDMRAALESGKIAWYCADVLEHEPMLPGDPLLGAPHCILTPHIAWATNEARVRLMEITTKNIAAFLAGSPINVVNK